MPDHSRQSLIWEHDALTTVSADQLPAAVATIAANHPDVHFRPPGKHPNNRWSVGFMVIRQNAVYAGDLNIDQDEASSQTEFEALLAGLPAQGA